MKFSASVVTTALLAMTHNDVSQVQAAFQSGPHSGAVYAASMVVDKTQVFYTGITYDPSIASDGVTTSRDASAAQGTSVRKPHCFVAKSTENPIRLEQTTIYAAEDETSVNVIGDACRGLAVLSPMVIAVVGTADPGGVFGSEATDMPQLGFGMTIRTSTLEGIAGTSLFTNTRVPYPQAVVHNPAKADNIYVASMTSNQDALAITNDKYPNWTHLFQHGTAFELTVESLSAHSTGIDSHWTRHFPVQPSVDGGANRSVQVGGMIFKPNIGLIVAGSTAAQGEAYGPSVGADEDGFVTFLDPETGEYANPMGGRWSQRFGTSEFDIVTSICDDPTDPNAFYIVGATQGDMGGRFQEDVDVLQPPPGSLEAFVRRVYVEDLQTDWTAQMGAWVDIGFLTETAALGCAVNSEGHVNVVGLVKDGAGMLMGQELLQSSGDADVWVAQFDGFDGSRRWMHQVGSEGEESIAREGPISIDSNDNAVIFGSTTGSLYRNRDVAPEADLFVMTFIKEDGFHLPTLAEGGQAQAPIQPTNPVVTQPPVEEQGSTSGQDQATQKPETQKPVATQPPLPTNNQPATTTNNNSQNNQETLGEELKENPTSMVGLVVGAFAAFWILIGCFFFMRRSMRHRDRAPVSIYDAAAADLDDAHEIPSSRTGGWGLSLFRGRRNTSASDEQVYGRTNLNYRDDPEFDDAVDKMAGNFHKTYNYGK